MALVLSDRGRGGDHLAGHEACLFGELIDELERYCERHGVQRIADLTGAVDVEEVDEEDVAWVGAA